MSAQTTYYRVYPDEDAPRDRPWGLFRRIVDGEKVVSEDAYDPRVGWRPTDYWYAIRMRGADEDFLVEVDEQGAVQTQEHLNAVDRDNSD